jgi:CIC family chloride channel protein
VGFTRLIELTHDLFYGWAKVGSFGLSWLLLIVLPVIGALLVGLITYFFAREAKGHGVPEVMNAIATREGCIRPRVALAKAVASALTIGSGGSAGTEGPIIQIGAALGSSAGRVLHVSRHNLPILVGAGAAAGISAIFHAPIAGVLFALEIFLVEVSFRTFSPVLMASVLSSVVVSAMLGSDQAIFPLLHPETEYAFHWLELGNYLLLGVLCALTGVAFIRLLYWFEDLSDRVRLHHILKPAVGAVGLGVIGIATAAILGEMSTHEMPSVFGNGYPLIGRAIGTVQQGHETAYALTLGALALLLAGKLVATCLTLGSGGSGGVFAPSLFLGAMVGHAVGLVVEKTGLFPEAAPVTYALVGMAAVVAATTHAPMAAIVILFEMTRNYRIILPVMFAATVALAVAKLMFRDSIYTLKLRRRGIHYESRAQTAILRRITVATVASHNRALVPEDMGLHEVIRQAAETETMDFVVTDAQGRYRGVLYSQDLRAALLQPESVPLLVAGELAREVPTVHPSETLDSVLDKFTALDVNSLPVRREIGDEIIGMITQAALMRRYQQELAGHNGSQACDSGPVSR